MFTSLLINAFQMYFQDSTAQYLHTVKRVVEKLIQCLVMDLMIQLSQAVQANCFIMKGATNKRLARTSLRVIRKA
jgi:hypothetical protein